MLRDPAPRRPRSAGLPPEGSAGRRWAILLAGGEGERLKALTRAWLGSPRPKQYCEFLGGRTMLEHTAERAAKVLDGNRLVTVIGKGHWAYLEEPRRQDVPGLIIEQPEHKDTGPGVLLPLAYVLALDPRASVVLFPSDHFIHPDSSFVQQVRGALSVAERLDDRIVLLGAAPDRPEREYGWIETGPALHGRFAAPVRSVRSFVEKPDEKLANELFRTGALWNTMIIAFKAETLWNLAGRILPSIMSRFQELRLGLEGHAGLPELAALYEGLDSANFSRDFLTLAAQRCVVVSLTGVHWSDWGRPERIAQTLSDLGEKPASSTLAKSMAYARLAL